MITNETPEPAEARSPTRMGRAVRYFYRYLISVDYYIDQKPLDPQRVPFLREELDKMGLMLSRTLKEVIMFDVPRFTVPQSSYVSDEGVLLTTRTIEIAEDSIPPEFDLVESTTQKITLWLDELEGDE